MGAKNSNLRKKLKKYNPKKVDDSVTLHALFHKHNGICCQCGVKTILGLHPQKEHSATMEHVVPLSRGGNHSWDNVELLCHKCNRERNHDMVIGKITDRSVKSFSFFGYEIIVRRTK